MDHHIAVPTLLRLHSLAEINKKGEVIKIYDHNGNELKINFLNNEVYFNKPWWQFTKIQSLI
ncbi:hypothetical protein NYZ61_07300 [Acinetobacter baumannii]|nr:hypothetical protein [Acinetobacter baumannii]